METVILRPNPVNPEPAIISEAAGVIRSGGLVAFPTETVYGVGADAFNAGACERIFRAKGRHSDNPLIVHISGLSQLGRVAADVPDGVLEAAKVVWPGPVTLILKAAGGLPLAATAGLETVAVRMPAHPVALRLIDAAGTPIAAPSANLSGRPSPTTAEHVVHDLGGKIEVIMDCGKSAFGLESTIIDMTRDPPVLLRPGAFTVEELEACLGKAIARQRDRDGRPLAPGMKYRHYAPDTLLVAAEGRTIIDSAAAISAKGAVVLCSDEVADALHGRVRTMRLGSEANIYQVGGNLFASFRALDSHSASAGVVQLFTERGIGLAIRNRTMKACDGKLAGSAAELEALISKEVTP